MEFMSFKQAALAAAVAACAASGPAFAQDTTRPAVGADLFYSTDSDDTEVVRAAAEFDLRNYGENDRLGLRVERAWYTPQGQDTTSDDRVFVQLGKEIGDWQVRARVGTDMHTIIGALSANDQAKFRKEVFLERDIVPTPRGLDDTPIYSTFGGAAIDIPLNERNVVNLLAGYQTFTGDNERVHLRGTYIHVLKPEWGLSAQLRGRYFNSSTPREFDYYSPEYYIQVLPVLQLRRWLGEGWMVQAAGGIGAQKDDVSDWRQSNYAQLRVESPRGDYDWAVNGEVTYSNQPSDNAVAGSGYDYFQTLLGVTKRF